MPKFLSVAGLIPIAFGLILSPALLAQGGHGQAGGFGGGAHSSGTFGHVQLSGGSPSSGAHWGSLGGAVVPPIASSSRGYGYNGSSYHYGNGQSGLGFGSRRYPAGYIPYFTAAYPFFYPDSAPPPTAEEAYGPPPQEQSPDLMMELDAIHQELADLRQRQAGPTYGMSPEAAGAVVAPAPSKPTDPPLILIFRDGTRTEVRDFAVVGQTFWDLSGHPTRKFPISQLNLDASIQANEARGVEFPSVPKAQ
jgi:hypothetical protein